MITKTKIALVAALVLTSASAVLAAPRQHVRNTFEGQSAISTYAQSDAERRWMDRASQSSLGAAAN